MFYGRGDTNPDRPFWLRRMESANPYDPNEWYVAEHQYDRWLKEVGQQEEEENEV